jgi:SARP family transcriptional regulator, regulator of embCAB operon
MRVEMLMSEPARPLLTAHLLGSFRVAVDGVFVDTVSSQRTRNVLAYLLAHSRFPVPRDVLMEVFWPTAEPKAARNSLHVALSGIRQALRAASPHPLIERRFDTYRIADSVEVWTDAEHFERSCEAARRAEQAGDREAALRCYEAACQLYQGDFLAEDPYLEWAAATRERLRLDAVEAQGRLMAIYIKRADHGPATVLGRRILAIDPCNEQVHRRLMTSYAGSGQHHLALSQYQRLAEALWETFRVRPSAETTTFYEWLRRPGSRQSRGGVIEL